MVLRRRTLLIILTSATFILVVASLLVHRYKLEHGIPRSEWTLLDLDKEANIPSWFSSFLLLAAAGLAVLAASGAPAERRSDVRPLRSLAGLLLLCSIDEMATLHERAGLLLDRVVPRVGPLIFSWVVLGGAVVVAAAILMWRFIVSSPGAVRIRLVLAAVLYVSGALGCEMLEGVYCLAHGRRGLAWVALTTIEETAEMLGVILLLDGLLLYLIDVARKPVTIRFAR